MAHRMLLLHRIRDGDMMVTRWSHGGCMVATGGYWWLLVLHSGYMLQLHLFAQCGAYAHE